MKNFLAVASALVTVTLASSAFACPAAKDGKASCPTDGKTKCCATHEGSKTEAAKTKTAPAKKPVQLVNAKVCPIMNTAVEGNGSGHSAVGAYRVFFCCGGCKTVFDKLPKAEKLKKTTEALKIQQAAAKKKA